MVSPEFDPTRYRFACTACGQCCRGVGEVRLTVHDIRRLATAEGLEERTWIQLRTRLAYRRDGLSLVDGAGGACIYLEEDRCRVYADRPEQCRRYPFAHTTPAECPGLHRLQD